MMEKIEIKCPTGETLHIHELHAFQGNLKKRTGKDIDWLIQSIQADGLLMPFVIWDQHGVKHVIDGHARLEAISKMALEQPALLTQDLPVLYIEAADEDEAKKALLQITSQYGTVNKKGLVAFTANMKPPVVTAPCAAKVISARVRTPSLTKVAQDEVIMRLRIKKDLLTKFVELLKQTDGVTII